MFNWIVGAIVLFFIIRFAVSSGIHATQEGDEWAAMKMAEIDREQRAREKAAAAPQP